MNDHVLLTTGAIAGPGCSAGHRPVILSSLSSRGDRVSTVMRTDGSVFTVTVPSHGMDDGAGRPAPGRPWISQDSGRSELPLAGFLQLAAAAGVVGVPGAPVPRRWAAPDRF